MCSKKLMWKLRSVFPLSNMFCPMLIQIHTLNMWIYKTDLVCFILVFVHIAASLLNSKWILRGFYL